VAVVETEIGQPRLGLLLRRFLHDQLHPEGPSSEALADEDLPSFWGRINVYKRAHATYYAPGDFSGTGGMHREIIRATPSWRHGYPRYDTVLIQNTDDDGMRGMVVGRVRVFLSFTHDGEKYPCALVEWFVHTADEPDPVTGMWIIKPKKSGRRRDVGVVHLDCIVRGCQLIGVYGDRDLPSDFHYSYTHDLFRRFYVNRWVDYHAHEVIQ
jgi:hypothetical protein